jgi:hypothetical protein
MLKGISESTAIENKVAALKIVDRIEKRLRITEKFFRGYGQSEALVKMIRTPNNTFPLYWCDKTKKGDKWPAPFPRKR